MPVTGLRSRWTSGHLEFIDSSGNVRFKIQSDAKPLVKGVPASVVYTIGTEATNAITINIQVNDGNGDAMATRCALPFYLSDDANGDSIAATAPTTSVAAGTDGFIWDMVAKKSFFGVTEADGDLDVVITETGADTWYLVAVLPDGSLDVSAAITFA